ncbi:MAG: ribonuclease HII [Candidatus Falkowbacteria bacterium]
MLDLSTEKGIFELGYQLVAGVDEAGRGPLAGPVVAACVVIGPDFKIDSDELKLVADSKKLSAKNREKLFSVIKEKALAVEISVISHLVIDKINILQASLLAMKKAVEACKTQPDFVLIDGNIKIPGLLKKQQAIVSGDAKVFCIAAASIIAKVSRDFLMCEADKKYPNYQFAKHKGYGTKLHLEMLNTYGPCAIHRRSFAPVKDLLK